jgi:hypothetical protein
LSLLAAALCAIASAGGLILDATYARETALWAAQGVGQDLVNLVVAAPAVFAAAWFAHRGSPRATLIWFGLLMYLAYSYVLYAFFVHFNALFLVYVAALGSSVYALAGAAAGLDRDRWTAFFERTSGERALSAFLVTAAGAFLGLWLSEIVPALIAGGAPQSATDAGLIVNPVHVLDLAFVLPAMIVAAVSLWKRHPLGLVMAVPLVTFMTMMGAAIVGMALTISARGLASAGPAIPMAVVVAIAVWLTGRFLSAAGNPAARSGTRALPRFPA